MCSMPYIRNPYHTKVQIHLHLLSCEQEFLKTCKDVVNASYRKTLDLTQLELLHHISTLMEKDGLRKHPHHHGFENNKPLKENNISDCMTYEI